MTQHKLRHFFVLFWRGGGRTGHFCLFNMLLRARARILHFASLSLFLHALFVFSFPFSHSFDDVGQFGFGPGLVSDRHCAAHTVHCRHMQTMHAHAGRPFGGRQGEAFRALSLSFSPLYLLSSPPSPSFPPSSKHVD